MRKRLLIFAKAPVAGHAKTRLIPRLGAAGAAAMQAALVEHTVQRLVGPAWHSELWCAPDADHHLFRSLAGTYGLVLRTQRGNDLGARMHRALAAALDEADAAVLVGCDCPQLGRTAVEAAFTALQTADAVLAPAEDGGYGLIALRRPEPRLFEGIAWGGQDVLAATRRAMDRCALRRRELATVWDLDRPVDLARLAEPGLERLAEISRTAADA